MSQRKAEVSQPRLVVGVGASAGGLEAFKTLLSVLPANTGMAFLLVQHLDPTHKSLLAELLNPCTQLPVHNADQGTKLEPDSIYVIIPDTALAVHGGRIELSQPTLHRGVRLPVDHLFRSLAREYGSRAAGIVLSGAGSDGSAGIREIKGQGGLTIAQCPESGSQRGMPQSSIDTGMVDLVLEIDQIPAALQRFANLPPETRIDPSADPTPQEKPTRLTKLREPSLEHLATLLEAQQNFDLRVYKSATVERRVLRRLTLSGFDDVDDYLQHIARNPTEQQTLVRDLLISVTDFFRDPEAFAALRESVIDPLVASTEAGTTLRAWIPGCATGEEAYSIAIEFFDSIQLHNRGLSLQIFATDIDVDALAIARTAIYPPSIADHIPERRLKEYFKDLDGRGYQVRSPLREVVSFAVHDLTKDPPFSRMHLVSCRNVLIYLTSEVQKHVLNVLHFALESQGALFLSTSETTGPQRDLFSTVSKKQRLYRKVGSSLPLKVLRSRSQPPPEKEKTSSSVDHRSTHRGPGESELIRRAVLQACLPPSIVVASDDSAIYTHGELSSFLRFPQDDSPRFDLSSLLRPEIATRTRGALYKCRRNKEAVVVLSSPDGAGGRQIRITARPTQGLAANSVIISFEKLIADVNQAPPGHEPPERLEENAIIEQLEKELQATREDLRTTVEELETSNEELRSSNEESVSMNEELQSANEELEATTEELRSLNEELTTVNAQLREKVEQIEQAHDDLANFFSSTKIATIFLDENLCIKRFTPAASELLGIGDAEHQRPIGHIARELLQEDLEGEVRSVLKHLAPRSLEVHTKDGRWISRQVLPYRTESRRIEGVVVTFTDITELKTATERLAFREQQQSVVARLGLSALQENQLHDFMEQVVRDVRDTLNADYCEILELQPGHKKLLLRSGIGWDSGFVGTATEDAGSQSPAGHAIQSQKPVIVDDLAKEARFSKPELLRHHDVTSGLTCLVHQGDYRYGVIGAFTKARRQFTTEDMHFMQAVANVVGSAIGRYQSRMRATLELGVAQVFADATELETTLELLLERIASRLEVPLVAELWWAQKDELQRQALHITLLGDRQRVERHFCHEKAPPDGLVAQVYERQRAVWITDLGNPDMFAQNSGAKELGLVSGVAFPIRAGKDCFGVISIFSTQRLFADQAYLQSLETVGRFIGDFIARWKADEAARQLATITASSHDAILSYRLDGTVTKWLEGAETLFGYSEHEMVGQSVEKIVPPTHRDELWSINERIVAGEVVEPFETERVCKSGKSITVSVRSSPIRDRQGRVVGISSTDRDISRTKETERKLLAADRQKDEFIAMLGHELRNPLSAIRSASELLELRGDDPHAVKRAQPIIQRQSAHMAHLLDGLLDVSRIIRGKIELEEQTVDLLKVCREVCSDMTDQLNHRDFEIQTDSSSQTPCVKGDRVRITQIVDNLVSNAIKYTREGDRISVTLEPTGNMVELKVKDNGAGIETELLPHVFEVFRQSEQHLDRSHGGLGLGLALVKTLVELHGGTVVARSEGKDKGSEFVVRLPRAESTSHRGTTAEQSRGTLRLLIIEDNQDSAELLQEVLEMAGHDVLVATRAQTGIEMARKEKPDVVLCDLGLPDGASGFDVARSLRADLETKAATLVALTGYGHPEDKKRCAEAGFDRHLTKPVDGNSILKTIEELRGTKTSN